MIQTLSNLTIIIYAIAVMTMLLDTTPARLSRNKLRLLWAGAGIIALLQFFAGCVLGIKIYLRFYFFFAQLPVFLLFWQLSGKGLVKTFFATLSAIFMCVPAMFASRISREFLPVSKTVDYLFLLLTSLIMLWLIHHFMQPVFGQLLDTFSSLDILKFSAIPFLYNATILASGGYLSSERNVLLRFLIGLSTLTAYFLLLMVFGRTRKIHKLEYEREMQTLVLESARQSLARQRQNQEQARIYRHDMRHHLALINGYAAEGNLEKIKEYLSQTEMEIDAITPKRYCANETVNLVLSSFEAKSAEMNVTLCIEANLPETLSISDTELCSLFSNALENAIFAASKLIEKKARRVYLRTLVNNNKLLISTKNAYAGTIQMEGEFPKSSNHQPGHGFGIKSMAAIVTQHGGLYSFEASGNIFTLQLMLPLIAKS